MPGSNLVTARLVDVDMAEGEGTPGRAPAHLADSPTGSQEVCGTCTEKHKDSMCLCHFTSCQQLQPGLAAGNQLMALCLDFGPQVDRDMDVSSGDEEVKSVAAAHKKKHLTEDEREAVLAAKGANKAKEWLELEFGGYKKVCEEVLAQCVQQGICMRNKAVLHNLVLGTALLTGPHLLSVCSRPPRCLVL